MTAALKLRILGVMASIVLGLMLVPVIDRLADLVRDAYDGAAPIAAVVVTREAGSEGEVRLSLRSTRLRAPAAEMIAVQAYEAQGRDWRRINAARVDGAPIVSHAVGMPVQSSWRLWPTAKGALRLVLIYDDKWRIVRLTVPIPA